MSLLRVPALLLFVVAADVCDAQVPDADWELEDGYASELNYVHSLVNYAFDLEWQYDWERRRFADNALRVNTGSVSSDKLLTHVDINLNQPLNDRWRFSGRFWRDGRRQPPVEEEQLLLGFEYALFESSAVYLEVNPEYDKEFIDVAAGYAWYSDDREQYLRLGAVLEDLSFESKNGRGGRQEQDPVYLEWAARHAIGGEWFLYSEGRVGRGFERRFPDAAASAELASHDRGKNRAEVRVSKMGKGGVAWSVWGEWYRFEEAKTFRSPGFDYRYENTQFNVSAEHIRRVGDRHRLRLVAHYVDQQAESVGFRAHNYDRQDLLGGVFYEYLWPTSGVTVAYAFGKPDIELVAVDPTGSFDNADYRDKVILGYRYTFSADAVISVSIAHEVATSGFGGGAVQFQMFF